VSFVEIGPVELKGVLGTLRLYTARHDAWIQRDGSISLYFRSARRRAARDGAEWLGTRGDG
jgi:hypothetical protein